MRLSDRKADTGACAASDSHFLSNNKTLLGIVRALAECKVICPDEVSILDFDDFAWTENFHPKLTTIVQPAEKLGRRGTEMLIGQIKMQRSR
jgi:LacI family transcriptional regulator